MTITAANLSSQSRATRVVVASLGSAAPRVRHAIGRALGQPEQEVARRLLQAPSVLAIAQGHEDAAALADALRAAGLVIELVNGDEPFESGAGTHEVALVVEDLGRIPEIVAEIAQILDVDLAGANALLWQTPAVLLAQISEATVDALRARFARVGATLIEARSDTSVFDLFIGPCDEATRKRAGAVVNARLGRAAVASGPLLAGELDLAEARRVWEGVARLAVPVRVLNRAFARYDVSLDRGEPDDALTGLLEAQIGMPARLIPRVLQQLPVVLAHDVNLERATELLTMLTQAGATATAHLTTFQTFDLELASTGDAQALRIALSAAGLSADLAGRAPPVLLEGPFPPLRARWIRHILRQAGATAHLRLRRLDGANPQQGA